MADHQDRSGYMHQELTEAIIGGAIEVHRAFGPGVLESCYEACLAHELTQRGIAVRRQVELPVEYKGVRVECGFRVDLVVEGHVIVELKTVEKILPIHEAQLFTYLRLTGLRVGLLINFNVIALRDGIRRRIL